MLPRPIRVCLVTVLTYIDTKCVIQLENHSSSLLWPNLTFALQFILLYDLLWHAGTLLVLVF